MSDQQVKYTITADASQANSELAKVDKAAASLVGNEKALATETATATKAIAEQGKVATTTAASTMGKNRWEKEGLKNGPFNW